MTSSNIEIILNDNYNRVLDTSIHSEEEVKLVDEYGNGMDSDRLERIHTE